jgi:hypothetical protein
MVVIKGAVGKGCPNFRSDVIAIQTLLNKNIQGMPPIKVDGIFGKATFQAILHYQISVFTSKNLHDGVINPGGKTLAALNSGAKKIKYAINSTSHSAAVLMEGHRVPPSIASTPSKSKLTDADFQNAARMLGSSVEAAMIRAFAEVESGGRSGFGATGFPKIAYEGHIFRKYTNGDYDKSHPKLSYKYLKKAGPEWRENNKNDAAAVDTLNKAMDLNKHAAYMACSWGMFQIMGFNFKKCGYLSVEVFVEAMKTSEATQLDAFIGFCKKTPGLVAALAEKNFVRCATLYNGEDYGDYDKRIARSYAKYSK